MNFQTEIETLIRARYPILYIITNEEMRAQNLSGTGVPPVRFKVHCGKFETRPIGFRGKALFSNSRNEQAGRLCHYCHDLPN